MARSLLDSALRRAVRCPATKATSTNKRSNYKRAASVPTPPPRWTDSYDRELKNIFTTQSDIAQAIAGALRAPLGLKEGQTLVSNRTADTDSYQDYLRARAFMRARGQPGGPLTEAVKLLEQVVARDPNYAPAWGLLGQAYVLTPFYSGGRSADPTDDIRRFAVESLPKVEAAAQQAARLDPSNIDGYTALATARLARGGFVQAEDLSKQALSLDPGNAEALHIYSMVLAIAGRSKDSLAMRLRLQALEPLVPVYNGNTARVLWENGRNEEAIAILKALPPSSRPFLAEVYASMGRYGEAADTLREIPSATFPPEAVEEAIRLLRAAPAQANLSQTVPLGFLRFVYLYVGASDRVLDFYERVSEAGYLDVASLGYLWAPDHAPVRMTERFKTFVREAGMLDYWRARGWPDHCRPMGADDFVCD